MRSIFKNIHIYYLAAYCLIATSCFAGGEIQIQPDCGRLLGENSEKVIWTHPYYAGFGKHSPITGKLPPIDWSIIVGIEIPTFKIHPEQARAKEKQLFKLSTNTINKQYYKFSSGGFFNVFLLHPNLTLEEYHEMTFDPESGLYKSEDYEGWAFQNATLVIKSLKSETLKDHSLENIILLFQRFIYTFKFLEIISPEVQYGGKPLFEVAKTSINPHDLSEGLVFQEPVFGPRVFDLMRLFEFEEFLNSQTSRPDTVKFFEEWGIDLSKKADLKLRIQAIELFYAQTHSLFLNLLKKNFYVTDETPASRLPMMYNSANACNVDEVMPVGIDFNHGKNVIYDVKKDRFVVVDG